MDELMEVLRKSMVLETILSTIILGVLGVILKYSKKAVTEHKSDHSLLQEANLFQIKATLLFMYKHSVRNNNEITVSELDVFNDLYRVYTKLGGNGFMNTIRNKVNEFNIVED